MDAKKFLNQAFLVEENIQLKLEQLEKYRALSESITSSMGECVQSSGNGDKIGNAVEKIIMLESEIDSEIDELVENRDKVRKVIREVSDAKIGLVLEYRYVMCIGFIEIANRMQYSPKQISRLHELGIKEVQDILDRGCANE